MTHRETENEVSQALATAASDGNIDGVREALQRGAFTNWRNPAAVRAQGWRSALFMLTRIAWPTAAGSHPTARSHIGRKRRNREAPSRK